MLSTQTIKNIRRVREVARILAKYGFEELMLNTPMQRFLTQKRRLTWTRGERLVADYTTWERIRLATEELGATFIKGAQVLSNRPDILPEGLIIEFQKLQSNVPPFPFEKVRELVEQELGKPLEEVFAYFAEKTIGSASIGQVHRARLKDGTEVVVKVQRPGVKQVVYNDLAILKSIVRARIDFFKKQGILNPMDVVNAFDKSMMRELDYGVEARNIETFRSYYKDRTDFYVPRAFKEISTGRVLVLEFVSGCKITDIRQLEEWGLDPRKIAEAGLSIYLNQIFEHGFFHADPHPGNILIGQDGKINLIDFGMVGKLSRKDKESFAGLFITMALKDPRRMAMYFRRLSIESEIASMEAFENDLSELIDDFGSLDVQEASMALLSQRLQQIIFKYKLEIPGSIFIILRALTILEGIGKTIHPTFNTYDFIRPYGEKIVFQQLSAKNILPNLLTFLTQSATLLGNLPADTQEILTRLRQGRFKSAIEFSQIELILNSLNRVFNRLVVGLIAAALFLGSFMVVAAATASGNPTPIESRLGFIGAIFLAIRLYLTAKRKKNRDF